jgi:phospholipid transport system substrate-binding protein
MAARGGKDMAITRTPGQASGGPQLALAEFLRLARQLVSALGAVAAMGTLCWAGTPSDQLKQSVDQVIQILQDPKLKSEAMAAERRAAIRKVANMIFDFTETAKRALGPHWQNLSEKDREEFVGLFAELLEGAYVSKIEQYSGEPIRFIGDRVEGDMATVRTRIVTKKGTEVPIDYRMLNRSNRWLVYDVHIEGVSLVGNYRTQFNKIIQTASYEELVKRMKAHDSELNARPAPRS